MPSSTRIQRKMTHMPANLLTFINISKVLRCNGFASVPKGECKYSGRT